MFIKMKNFISRRKRENEVNKSKIELFSLQTSSDGNQTTSTLSITLSRSDAGKYLSCKAYNHMSPSDALEDGWKLDIQCK
jgi:immunoglobulin superfamily member 9B